MSQIQSQLQADPAPEGTTESVYGGLSGTAWMKIGIVSLLMIATFRFNLVRLWYKTNPFSGEENWRHAIVVPLVSLYYLYYNRDALLRATVKPTWSGLLILVGGILLFGYGIYPGQNDALKDIGMVIALFGVVLMLCGWRVMKIAWFSIIFLFCAIPWPPLVYQHVAAPLQVIAADVGVHTLQFFGVEAMRTGTKMIIQTSTGWSSLNVAEACAGLRSLMSFISVAGAIAFLSSRAFWQKLLIVFSAVPIAIFCNVMRVSGCGLLERYGSHEFSVGFAHQFVGLVMLIPGFFFLVGIGWVLDKLFIDEADRKLLLRVKTNRGPAPTIARPNAAGSAQPTVTQPQSSGNVVRRKPAAPVAQAAPQGASAAVAQAARALSASRPSRRSEGT